MSGGPGWEDGLAPVFTKQRTETEATERESAAGTCAQLAARGGWSADDLATALAALGLGVDDVARRQERKGRTT